MHPDLEIHHLISIARRCELLARSGQADEGHKTLRLAVCRAEELKRVDDIWGARILELWHCVLRDYRRRHLETVQ